MPHGRISFARKDSLLCIRLEGRIDYRMSSGFADFIERIFARDSWGEIVIDVTGTTAMDSTGLSLLAKIARLARQRRNHTVTVVSTVEKITNALISVGLDRLMLIVGHDAPDPAELEEMGGEFSPNADQARIILEAHRELMALNEKNASEFKNVVELLEQETGS